MQRSTLALSLAVLGLGACNAIPFPTMVDPTAECPNYANEAALAVAGTEALNESIPTTAENAAMTLTLSQDAVNRLFAELAEVDMPTLSESTRVLGQTAAVEVTPSLPLLSLTGGDDCPSCVTARVPINVGASIASVTGSAGEGSFSVRVPVGFIPLEDGRTQLVAQFQSIEVLDLAFELAGGGGGLLGNSGAQALYEAAEPIVMTLLSNYLQQRFTDIPLLTVDSWSLGQGAVALAPRGPFISPETGTLTLALQSNLPIAAGSVAPDLSLPEDAEVGLAMHPSLLNAMSRRMFFEGQLDPEASTDDPGMAGATFVPTQITSSDAGGLMVTTQMFTSETLCGSQLLDTGMALALTPEGIDFAVTDLAIREPRGIWALQEFAGNTFVDSYLDKLADVLRHTVNYNAITGGEAGSAVDFSDYAMSVDGRGLTFFMDLAVLGAGK